MRARQLTFLLVFGIINITFGQSFYDINTINTIEIEFEESNWDYLLDQLVAAGEEERLIGSVSINGQVFDSAGIRYKGNSSYNANQVKNPLNIKLDHIIDDQTIEGYGTLKLANVFKDPSFVREAMSYEIARNYFPASQANFANVYINGTHLGLYTSDQNVDKFFMRTHFASDENTRVKGEITSSGPPTGAVWEYYGTDSSSYYNLYDMKSDYGWDELIDFLDTLNNQNVYVDQLLNIDRHLWFLAFSNLFVNLDGPINNPQNYYLYKDDAGRFNPIPWDLNESFGVFTFHQTLGNLNTTNLQELSPFANIIESEYPVISKILTNDTYRKMYVAHYKTMMEENFSNGWYETRALEIQDIIDADVQADPNKFYTYSNFINNIYNSVGGGPNGVIGIVQLMDARVDYLNSLTDFQYVAPEIGSVAHSPEQVPPNSEVWFTAEVDNVNDVFLAYRSNTYSNFDKINMYDDGNHEDGQSGDGIYGISLTVGLTDLQYYIYAENQDAVAFSPARAEYEFYSISITGTGDLVINEFMADNETTVADPNGEYDDWVEFYNNGQSVLSLGGYYLTDDATEQDQWTFPDTTIAPGEYLVVWTDNDEEQEGLHANFKLSASGETIILSDPGLNILDVIVFGQQKTDTTTGRYPNGTGDFEEMPPTFGSENELFAEVLGDTLSYTIVDTGQEDCYDNTQVIAPPAPGEAFYGQDAQYNGNQPSYTDNGDGTVTDIVTGLMWQQSPDMDGDGDIDYDDKMSYDEAMAGAATFNLAGYTDWRLPSIKEMYSLILFSGEDPSGYEGTSTEDLVPFINTDYFDFAYGDQNAGERIIDAQMASSTLYVGTTMMGAETMFGVNFADGRIKGYPTGSMPGQTEDKQFYVMYVRGDVYGINDFVDNGNGTITDHATGLMWTQDDDGEGMVWENALSYAENFEFAVFDDWRLPNAKELQSIVDYARAPSVTNSAAIDPIFNCSEITDEGGNDNYPFYWSGSTHASWQVNAPGGFGAYVCFGEALGWMEVPPNSGNYQLLDVHGAGAQRSDPKSGDPDDWPLGNGPQGDVVRIYNYVRLVRDAENTPSAPVRLFTCPMDGAAYLPVSFLKIPW